MGAPKRVLKFFVKMQYTCNTKIHCEKLERDIVYYAIHLLLLHTGIGFCFLLKDQEKVNKKNLKEQKECADRGIF